MAEPMTPKRLAEIADSLPKAGTVPDEWLANPLTIGEMRQLVAAARPAPPPEPQAGSDTPWRVGEKSPHPLQGWTIYRSETPENSSGGVTVSIKHGPLAFAWSKAVAERIVAAVNAEATLRRIEKSARALKIEDLLNPGNPTSELLNDLRAFNLLAEARIEFAKLESRLREVEQELHEIRSRLAREADIMEQKFADVDRRDWGHARAHALAVLKAHTAALRVMANGEVPVTLWRQRFEKATADNAQLERERDEAREIARVRSADRQNHEAGCLCSPICRTIASWPSSGKA